MDIKVEEVSKLTRKVIVTLPAGDVQPKIEAAYNKLKKEVKIKGFRRGKVPSAIIVKNYKDQVEAELSEKLVQENYFNAVEKEGLDPVTHPEIQVVKYNEDGSFTFEAHVDVRPDFELGNYKGLEIEKPAVAVADEDIDAEIAEMQKKAAALHVVDRPAVDGDMVTVDFQGFENGEALAQVKSDDHQVDLGAGSMGKDFEAKLVGMSKGEVADHQITFPENHPNVIIKGKTIDFKLSVKDVKERILADLDDEFAKDAGEEFNSMDELKASIRARRIKKLEESAEGVISDRLMQKLLEGYEFEVPTRLVAHESEQMIKQTEQQLQQSGLTLEAAGLSKEKLVEENVEVAAQRVRGDFLLKKIAEVEDIKVADEDMDRGFKRIGDMYNMTVAQVKEFFQSRDDLLPFMNELLNEKILAFLRSEAVMVEEKAVEATDVQKEGASE
ncbi:trigger factor [Desulfotalea psychrophila]|uniref:Trigger factor n=1 Tax=Desulfotalea psychrophila (strain LSv54 / DSM 12343) TaxID=177439 RepID=TIG_DESPS|nr:trigger factor [Desulfotalea psychrophila]Q6AK58.2 RecName: Full=Trigger factor; Short=TF; AltName: Full=PPIase [Desulfotalea psychrophila LSv54]